MVSLRTDVEAAGFGSTFPYMFMYLYYEQYAIIVQEAITNLALALIAVFVICTLIISNVAAACMVMLCVVLVDVDILGLMYVWGLTIDSVAIVNLVLAIGLAVDYSAHIAHAFMQATGTRQERVDKALEEMGVAVIHGAFSTFLAVVVLSVSKSYIFRVFFKQFFGICVFGALHGLVLLPTLLSLIGPASAAPEAAITNAKVPKSVSAMTSTASAASSVDGVPQVPKSPPTEITVPSPPPSAPGSGRDSSQKRVTPITV
jgi:Niemann-Pick C1 protein